MKTFKKWILDHFAKSDLREIVQFDVDADFSGLIDRYETAVLYKNHAKEIWGFLCEDADNKNMNIFELISSFKDALYTENQEQFENLLVLYAVERIAWDIIENSDRDECAPSSPFIMELKK